MESDKLLFKDRPDHPVAVQVELRVSSARFGEFVRRVEISPSVVDWEKELALSNARALVMKLQYWLWPNDAPASPEAEELHYAERKLVDALQVVRAYREHEEQRAKGMPS